MATYNVRKILKARRRRAQAHPGDGAASAWSARPTCWPTPARMLSAGADDAVAGGVSRALDVLDRADFPTRPEALSRWSVIVFLEDAQAPVRPELGPDGGVLPRRPPAGHRGRGARHRGRGRRPARLDRRWRACRARSSCSTRAARRPPSRRSRGASPQVAGQGGFALAAALPALRAAVIDHTIDATARQNALVGAVIFLPGADMPVMTMNQLKMVLRIGAAYGYRSDLQRTVEMLGVICLGSRHEGARAARRRLRARPRLGDEGELRLRGHRSHRQIGGGLLRKRRTAHGQPVPPAVQPARKV